MKFIQLERLRVLYWLGKTFQFLGEAARRYQGDKSTGPRRITARVVPYG